MVSGLALIGAPGSGKSSVLEKLSSLLEAREIAHGAIESEELARGWPPLEAEHWIAQLRSVLALQRRTGRTVFLVAATTETADELQGVLAALDAERIFVVCLRASPEVVAARIEQREPDSWPGKQRLIDHARRLAADMPRIRGIDLIIDTDLRDAVDVAAEIRDALIERRIV